MMASNWNFRTILNLQPESDSFSCVSTKPDNSARCHNRRPLLSDMDLAKAGGLLDAMDRCESLKASYKYLNELARLTLCIIHSEGDDQVELVSAIWQSRIEKHMKTEVEPAARPKTRRSIGRRRTSSITVMTVLKEEKAEQSPTSATKSPASRIPVPSPARQDSNTSTRSRPTRNMSRKISSLISEVGFQDSSNEQYLASMESPKTPKETPPMPSRAPPAPPARRMPIRSKTKYPPAAGESDEWSSYPLLSLLTRSSNILKSDEQLGDQMAEAIEAGVLASRGRTNTASSVGSSTTGSKASSTESDSGSSAPTSRSSSVKNSPELKPTEESELGPFPAFPLPPSMIASGPLSASPTQAPLPTFDFGIFQSLPLPPGHKQSISNVKESTPVSNSDDAVKVPPRTFEFDSSRPSFALKALEKPRSRKSSQSTQDGVAESNDTPAPLRSRDEIHKALTSAEEKNQEAGSVEASENFRELSEQSITLPECDTMSMISTSWLNTPRPSRTSSITSRLSRASSDTRSPPLSRTTSLSRTASLSRSASGKLSRTSSFSLSRTLSRSLSRRASTKTSPKIDEEGPTTSTSTATPPRRTSSFSLRQAKAKEDTISLPRLIQMSHELARRLDGQESHGYVEVRPSTSYKYQLPSATARSSSPVPEIRFSKLFMTDMAAVSLNFPFSVPITRKPVAEPAHYGRSKSVGNGSEAQREIPKFVRPEMNLAAKLAPIPKTGPRQTLPVPPVPKLQVPPMPVREVEVCAMCGNTQTIWGRCDCGTPVSARGKVGDTRERVRTPAVGERPVVTLGKMERRPTKRMPKRASTLRRIRKRVVRAFSI